MGLDDAWMDHRLDGDKHIVITFII